MSAFIVKDGQHRRAVKNGRPDLIGANIQAWKQVVCSVLDAALRDHNNCAERQDALTLSLLVGTKRTVHRRLLCIVYNQFRYELKLAAERTLRDEAA